MKIGVFAYTFPHYKTMRGILSLFMRGMVPEVIMCQESKFLPMRTSLIRTAIEHKNVFSAMDMADKMGSFSIVAEHDSDETVKVIKDNNLDLGIVLGARILKKRTIDAFNVGILNMHPGIIPWNRGLDNIQRAIIHFIVQGVTTHLIDYRVDMGRIIDKQILPVTVVDSLHSIHARLLELQMTMMLEAIKWLGGTNEITPPVTDPGNYFEALTLEEESLLLQRFDYYKKHYADMYVERRL